MSRDYKQSGLAPDVAFGDGGPRLVANAQTFELRDTSGNLTRAKAAPGVASDDVATVGQASGGPQLIFTLDCAAESVKTLVNGANILDDGNTLYGRDLGTTTVGGKDFDGVQLRLQAAPGTTSNYNAGVRDSPTVYLSLDEVDPDYSPANRYAFLVDAVIANEVTGARQGIIGCEYTFNLGGAGFYYAIYQGGHNGTTNDRFAIKSTVESNTDAEGATDAGVRAATGKMVSIDQVGACVFGSGSGWTGSAWGPWANIGVGHCNLNTNRTRITTKLGTRCEVRPLIGILKTVSAGTATIDVNRIEIWRISGGAFV